MLTTAQEKGYEKECRLSLCKNKANLSSRARRVPTRAFVETQDFASLRRYYERDKRNASRRHYKQSPLYKTKPICRGPKWMPRA
jgi:hypothetical protein